MISYHNGQVAQEREGERVMLYRAPNTRYFHRSRYQTWLEAVDNWVHRVTGGTVAGEESTLLAAYTAGYTPRRAARLFQ